MVFEHNTRLLLSAQRALLGAVYPEVRAVSVGILSEKLFVNYYLDRPLTDEDRENLSIIATELLADFPDIDQLAELCEFDTRPVHELDRLMGWVYIRKEA